MKYRPTVPQLGTLGHRSGTLKLIQGKGQKAMVRVGGTVRLGVGHFGPRMKKFADVFREATGEPMLYPGTLNVEIDREIPFREHFQIAELVGDEWGWVGPVRFEICRIDSMWAYRIKGGHDQLVVEICS